MTGFSHKYFERSTLFYIGAFMLLFFWEGIEGEGKWHAINLAVIALFTIFAFLLHSFTRFRNINGFAIFLCCYLLYTSMGNFIGTFKTDETFFLQSTWSSFHGYSSNTGFLTFFLILKAYWIIVNGAVSTAWCLRILILFLAGLQAAIIFKLSTFVLPTTLRSKWLMQFMIVCVFITVMSSFRGYEIRPEILPNTMLLFAAYMMFRLIDCESLSNWNWFLVFLTGIGLVLGASISLRHTMPAFAFFAVLLFQVYKKRNNRSLLFWALVLISIAITLFLNLGVYNIFEMLGKASEHASGQTPVSWLTRLSVGGGKFYLFAFSALVVVIIYMIRLFLINLGFRQFFQRVSPAVASFLALVCFYIFLFLFDARPFGYIRSIEWTLIVILLFTLLRELRSGYTDLSIHNIIYLLVTIVFVVVSLESVFDLNRVRRTTTFLHGLVQSASTQELYSMSDSALLERMISSSILDQVRSRAVYCERYPDGLALVFAFAFHPICLRDGGSLDYFSWEGDVINTSVIDFKMFQYLVLPPAVSQSAQQLLEDGYSKTNIKIGDIWIRN